MLNNNVQNFLTPNWPAPANIKAYTTLRNSWYGRGQDVDDAVIQSLINTVNKPIWLSQKHTADAVEATDENRLTIADASYTSQLNRVCAVLTADCLPVLVCDKEGSQVAAIHAGWRGLAAGIIENTIAKLHAKPDDILVWLGPAIGPQKFEVGQDVHDAFTQKHLESARAFLPHADGKWMANLYELAKIRLNNLGINHIFGGDFCTYTQEDLFFSYRRDNGDTGRLASLIWRS